MRSTFKKVVSIGILAAGLGITAGLAVYYAYTRLQLFELLDVENLRLGDHEKLGNSPLGLMQAIALFDWPSDRPVRVLTLRQAEFAFYGTQSYRVDIDPRMLRFFQEEDPDAAFRILLEHGITHVYIPEEPYPSLYNSALEQIVHSARYVERADRFGRASLYSLRAKSRRGPEVSGGSSLEYLRWMRVDALESSTNDFSTPTRGGFRIRSRSALPGRPAQAGVMAEFDLVAMGHGRSPDPANASACSLSHELFLTLVGRGLVQMDVQVISKVDVERTVTFKLWHGVMGGEPRKVGGQFWNPLLTENGDECDPVVVRIVVTLQSPGEITLLSSTITDVGSEREEDSEVERQRAMGAGWSIDGSAPNTRLAMRSGSKQQVDVRHSSAYPALLRSPRFLIPDRPSSAKVVWRGTGQGRVRLQVSCAAEGASIEASGARWSSLVGGADASSTAGSEVTRLGASADHERTLSLPVCESGSKGTRTEYRISFVLHREQEPEFRRHYASSLLLERLMIKVGEDRIVLL